MATTAFSALLPEVLPQVIACPDDVATNAIRSSAIEFCERTGYWQETLDPETITPDDLPYDLQAPSGARVVQVLSVFVDGTPIPPISLDELDLVPNWRSVASSTVSAYYQDSPTQLGLYAKPSADVELVLRVAYAPTRTATGIENHVLQIHAEAFASGAMWRLMMVPGQPWSNPQLGEFHRAKFQRAVTDALIDANKTFGRALMTIQNVRFA